MIVKDWLNVALQNKIELEGGVLILILTLLLLQYRDYTLR